MRKMIIAVVTLAVACPAWAGEADAPAGSPLALLAHERVQKELKLTDDQVTAVKGLAASVRKGDTKPADAAATVKKALKDEQMSRLAEISYQVRGGAALADPKVAAALELTKEQKEKMAATREKDEAELKNFLARARFSSAAAMQEHIRKHRKAAGTKLLDVLTEGQKKDFTKMQGKAFETTGLDKE